jgi:hypothetical protein
MRIIQEDGLGGGKVTSKKLEAVHFIDMEEVETKTLG